MSSADKTLAGKYRLGGELGSGAFANVFAADHKDVPGLLFAVKVLKAEHAARPDLRRRFENEARALAALRSRHTVRVVDVGVNAEGHPYLVMERLEGMTLQAVITAHGTLGVAHVASLARDVLIALEEAHAAGVVHRDLKPSNVFVVNETGQEHPIAKVVDFGIAKLLEGSVRPEDHESTIDGTPCTPTYAAPEQLRGEPGPSSDLYALGHVMAAALTGQAPYADISVGKAIARHLDDKPVTLAPDVVAGPLGPIIARACEKQPADRYPDAAAMRRDVEEVIDLGGAIPPLDVPAARSQFVGSSDHTALGEWSAMSPTGGASGGGRSTDTLFPSSSSALSQGLGPGNVAELRSGGARRSFPPALLGLAALGALLLALASGYGLTRGGSDSGLASSDSPANGAVPVASAVLTPVEAALTDAVSATPVDPASAVAAALGNVADALTLPAANRWTISATAPGARAYVGDDLGGAALPLRAAFGPSSRPVSLRVEAPGFERTTVWVDHTGAVELVDMNLRPAAEVGSAPRRAPPAPQTESVTPPEPDGPRPGGLTILRP